MGSPAALSIRPHEIAVVGNHQTETVRARGDNLLRGTVQRASYLGDAVDCQVQVEGSEVTLRVAAPVLLSAQILHFDHQSRHWRDKGTKKSGPYLIAGPKAS